MTFHCVQVPVSGQQTNVCETHHVHNVTGILCVGSKFTLYSIFFFFRVLTPKLYKDFKNLRDSSNQIVTYAENKRRREGRASAMINVLSGIQPICVTCAASTPNS